MGSNDQQASFDADLEATPVIVQEDVPTSAYRNNASFVYVHTANRLVRIDMTIGGVTYRKTLTWVGDDNTAETAWSIV